mgnify:CR=1 FL=1
MISDELHRLIPNPLIPNPYSHSFILSTYILYSSSTFGS